ncbi:hypothetical protein ES705_49667 [subsurface metagenome]
MAKTVYLVQASRGKWVVKKKGAKRVSGRFDRKIDAVSYGRQRSRDVVRGGIKGESILIIHRGDGSIQRRHGYSTARSPATVRGKKGTSSTGPRRK